MSRKKQAERYKIITKPSTLFPLMMKLHTGLDVYRFNVMEVIGPPINDYIALAGFNTLEEAKAYRRKKIKEERVT